MGRLLSPRQHPSSSFKPIATLSAATPKALLLGAPFFAFKVYERKMEPSSWQDGLVPYIKTCWSIIRRAGELLRYAFLVSRLLSAHLHLFGGQYSCEDVCTQLRSWSIVRILVPSQNM